MARTITNRLDTGCALDGAGSTSLWAARSTTSTAPSGVAEAATFCTTGVAWARFDATSATAAVEVTVWSYVSAVGRWSIHDSFAFTGVHSFPVGAHAKQASCLGADYMHVQVTDVTGGGNITIDVTLSQEV